MNSSPEIFFSYAWGDEHEQGESREKIVNELYKSLLKDNYRIVRDKYNLEYKGFITDFMGRIGEGKCVIVAISEKYVRSPYCMFELYEIARNSNFDKNLFREKVIPVIVERIDFTDPAKIDDHFLFWENEYNEWSDLVKRRAGQLSVEQLQRFDKIKMIYQNFGRLGEWIADMNSLNPQILSADNFAAIKRAIAKKEKGGGQEHRSVKRLLKKPVFWISALAIIAAILFIPSWLSETGKEPDKPVHAFNVVRSAGEKLLIVQDLNTRRLGYARISDTSLFISCKYDEANPFNMGMALVKINSMYRWIKPDSTDAFQGQFDYAKDFQNGEAKVVKGLDSFSINRKGERLPLYVSRSTNSATKNKNQQPDMISRGNSNELPPPRICKAICDTKGIIGVEVSFTDTEHNKTYRMVSDGHDMEFNIPCHLLEKIIEVRFRKNNQREDRNFYLKSFEIPEMFRNH